MEWARVDGEGRILERCAERLDGLDAELDNGGYIDETMGGGRALSDYRLVGTTAVYDPPQPSELGESDVAALVLEALASAARQDDPPGQRARPGYAWRRRYDPGVTAVVWEEVAEPGAPGTDGNPIPWASGMECWANYRYSLDGKTYVCVEDGAWDALGAAHFEEVG